jgi:hypothetical protein
MKFIRQRHASKKLYRIIMLLYLLVFSPSAESSALAKVLEFAILKR